MASKYLQQIDSATPEIDACKTHTSRRKLSEEIIEADFASKGAGRVTGKGWWVGVEAGDVGRWDMSLMLPVSCIRYPSNSADHHVARIGDDTSQSSDGGSIHSSGHCQRVNLRRYAGRIDQLPLYRSTTHAQRWRTRCKPDGGDAPAARRLIERRTVHQCFAASAYPHPIRWYGPDPPIYGHLRRPSQGQLDDIAYRPIVASW